MTKDIQQRRLYITPFNPEIVDRILPPPLKAVARDISFHSVETFPEKGFGYVDLPVMEAEKLKKKLNGAVLKGSKVRIEEARPGKKTKRKSEADEEEDGVTHKKAKKEKRKKTRDVVEGFELPEGRRVKRGWEDKNAKKVKDKKKNKEKKVKNDGKSLETQKAKLKIAVPPNAVSIPGVEEKKKSSKKEKKEKKEKGKRIMIVDEFSNTHRPTAGADVAVQDGKQTASFDEEQGWVNADGEIVENAPKSKRPKRAAREQEKPQPVTEAHGSATSESSLSESEESSVVSSDSEEEEEQAEEDDDDNETNQDEDGRATPEATAPPATSYQTPEKDVHPLEALFKRPATSAKQDKQKPMSIDTSFSFFNAGDGDNEADAGPGFVPQTPHTREDMEWRQLRSAAPTPDTAAIGKKFRFPTPIENGEDVHMDDLDQDRALSDIPELDEDEDDDAHKEGEKEESEFCKWFYENRGDLNRSWKKRRREERKSKRQRENRRLSRRVV